jgi:hypothetical protein
MSAGLLAFPGWEVASAAAHAAGPVSSCVIKITNLSFSPPVVSPGQLATANMSARNCTGQPESASVMWLDQFLGPAGTAGGIPPGCPAIDPLPPQPVSFAPYGSYSASLQTLVFSGCTATQLQVTVRFFGSGGTVLAQRTADLPIIQPSAGT